MEPREKGLQRTESPNQRSNGRTNQENSEGASREVEGRSPRKELCGSRQRKEGIIPSSVWMREPELPLATTRGRSQDGAHREAAGRAQINASHYGMETTWSLGAEEKDPAYGHAEEAPWAQANCAAAIWGTPRAQCPRCCELGALQSGV